MATKRQALKAALAVQKTAQELISEDCTCNLCRSARRLIKQLKPVLVYLED